MPSRRVRARQSFAVRPGEAEAKNDGTPSQCKDLWPLVAIGSCTKPSGGSVCCAEIGRVNGLRLRQSSVKA